MGSKVKQTLNDPKKLVQIAAGELPSNLVPQKRGSGIVKDGRYFSATKRYVLKKAHFGMADFRVFDTDGNMVVNSHHPGNNPLDGLDPLGLANTDAVFSPLGEWESLCDVTAHTGDCTSFKVRPKKMSMHGRQRVKQMGNDSVVMNVGKISRIKTRSMRHSFEICRGDDKDDEVYTVTADLLGRSLSFYNQKEEVIAIMAKTKKALILNAVLGAGSENTIDIAQGVDCSAIIAAVFAVLQAGSHLFVDAAKNFVVNPAKDAAAGAAVGQVMGEDGDGGLLEAGASAFEGAGVAFDGAGEAIMEGGAEAASALGGFLMEMFLGG